MLGVKVITLRLGATHPCGFHAFNSTLENALDRTNILVVKPLFMEIK
jgi:hypothetical protein